MSFDHEIVYPHLEWFTLPEAMPPRSSFKPVVKKEQASFTNDPAPLCENLVTELVHQILEDHLAYVPVDTMDTIGSKLKEMLMAEIAGFDIPVKMCGHQVISIAKAAHKELCKKMVNKEYIRVNLLLQQHFVYVDIVKTLARHLHTSEKETGVRFFEAMGNAVDGAVRTFLLKFCIILPEDD